MLTLVLAVLLAQAPRAPEAGGLIGSLGQPPRWRRMAGIGAGAFLEGPVKDVMVRAEFGVYHSALSPMTGIADVGAEFYVGARGSSADGGLRALLRLPYFGAGMGVDYNVRDGRTDMLVTLHTPVRRGGFLTRGTLLRLNWYPLQSHTFTLGVTTPLGDPLAGRNRPLRDYVVVAAEFPAPIPRRRADPALEATLDSVRASAERIRRLVAPFLDQDGRDAAVAVARTARYLGGMREQLAARSADDETRFFHAELEHAFTIASGSAVTGRTLAARSRSIVLDEILLPYNGLVGRKKKGDTLVELGVAARGRFAHWVAASGGIAPARLDAVLFAFEKVTLMLEEVRRVAAREWDDPRLAWLPLQYALLPEDYDEQRELDALVARATQVPFSDGNRLTYVANLQFHWELLRMIGETRDYHVLWIHDFPAVTGGAIDAASFTQVVDGYLDALRARVEAYDTTGILPSYYIFLDQHYYELRRSRLLMDILEDPLHAPPHLPLASAADDQRLALALERLRAAVEGSRVLQAEAREYGDAWLRNRVKVHVNITNRADASFWSGGLVSSVFGYPDDVMRDHRKLAFRDVTTADPWGGEAILTGMGVGQQYLGPGWDDRSLFMEGPVVLELRDAARELLLSQGLDEAALPPPFRPGYLGRRSRGTAPSALAAVAFDGRAAALVNGTGYLPKPLNVAKAVLYSLLPAGSVLKIPDSLWNSTFYASLLVGACLRGARVLIIAPALSNAPSDGFPQMIRAHELFTRLLLVRRELHDALAAAGGDLRLGLYALPRDDRGFASRAERWARQLGDSGFAHALFPFARAARPAVVEAAGSAPAGDGATPVVPRLHQKVQFLATRALWDSITGSREWPAFMAAYLRYRALTYSAAGDIDLARERADALAAIARRILAPSRADPQAAGFAIVGSQNQDYRGMFMDGEIGILFSGSAALVPLIDLVFMAGTVDWIEDQQGLDALLPPMGELRRRIARIAKDGV